MSKVVLLSALVGAATFFLVSCDTVEEGPLAPYEGERPFEILAVTESFAPDIQWVGGRAAAVGINRGVRAALDSTLVWLVRVDDNLLDSPLRVREQNDEAAILSLGGTPLDSLLSDSVYTFWVADKRALDAGFDGAQADPFSLIDTTFALEYFLEGGENQTGGDRALDLTIRIIRDKTLLEDRYIVEWSPAVPVRQVAIRQAPTGGFTNLVWHVAMPDDVEGSIMPPLIIGETPPGAQEAVPWPADGFTPPRPVPCPEPFFPPTYVLWMITDNWGGSFSPSADGYAWTRILSRNFEKVYACPE